MVPKDFSKIWKLRVFLLVIFSLFFACESPAANPADFRAQDLSGQDFSGLHIQDFDLSGKNLQNTSFQSSDLPGTNFTGADLKGASFEWAILYGANFTNADLRGANLDAACGFQYATWTGATLDVKWEKIVALFEDGQLVNQNLQGYDLSSICFEDIKWDSPDFSGANLEDAFFQYYADDLAHSNFQHANLQATDLSAADLTNADFTGAFLLNTDLRGSNLTGAQISSEQLSEAIFNGCTLLPNGSLVNVNAECRYPVSAP